jgi:hypothetical protein
MISSVIYVPRYHTREIWYHVHMIPLEMIYDIICTYHMKCTYDYWYDIIVIWHHLTWLWYYRYISYEMYIWYHSHISKASLWNLGMQDSARYWAQYWHKASIQKQFLHMLWYLVHLHHINMISYVNFIWNVLPVSWYHKRFINLYDIRIHYIV